MPILKDELDALCRYGVLKTERPWPWPNFIGLQGFLNSIRFAIDRTENAFYFGPV